MIASGLRLLILALLFASALGAAACRDEAAANLQQAYQTYDRLTIGMSKADACWNMGTSCENDWTTFTHTSDVGQSFSKKEYQVTMRIENEELVYVAIIKPAYVRGVRQGGKGAVVVEKKAPGYAGAA